MKKTISIFLVLITMVSLITTTVLAAPTAMLTPTVELGQLKVCKVAGSGVEQGTLFSFRVNGNLYSIPAGPADRNGYCILAGQYPVNTQVPIEEVIPSGYYVSRIEVRPDRTISKDTGQGKATVNIVSGVIEAIFTNRAIGSPTQMPTSTTPRPTKRQRLHQAVIPIVRLLLRRFLWAACRFVKKRKAPGSPDCSPSILTPDPEASRLARAPG